MYRKLTKQDMGKLIDFFCYGQRTVKQKKGSFRWRRGRRGRRKGCRNCIEYNWQGLCLFFLILM